MTQNVGGTDEESIWTILSINLLLLAYGWVRCECIGEKCPFTTVVRRIILAVYAKYLVLDLTTERRKRNR